MNQLTKIPTVEQFLEFCSGVSRDIETACKMIVLMADTDTKVYDKITKLNPRMTYNVLGNMYRAGKGEFYFELLFDGSPGAKALLSLPAPMQREVYHNTVPIRKFENGNKVTVQKRIQELTPKEAVQAVNKGAGRLRSIEEQDNMLSQSNQPHAKPAQRYQIVGEVAIINGLEFDIATLEQIIELLKARSLKSLGETVKKNQIR